MVREKTLFTTVLSYTVLGLFQSLDPLTNFLKQEGRMIFRVHADGNCMFHALSHQLFGSPQRDFEVRSLLVRFENLNHDIFSPLLTEINEPDMRSHVRKMLRPGIWGTHIELLAAASYFQITIYIVKGNQCAWEALSPLGPQSNLKYQLNPEIDFEEENVHLPRHIELLHVNNCHYDSLTSTSGQLHTTPPRILETHFDCTHINLD